MPTPKPDAAVLLSDDIEQLRRFLSGHASMSPASRIAAFGALLAEREEARRIIGDLVETAERFDTDAMHSVAARARAHLSGKRSAG